MTRARSVLLALACAIGLAAIGARSARAPTTTRPRRSSPRAPLRSRPAPIREAIDDFEALSDRGFVHPDASFDRGLAYVIARPREEGPAGRSRAAPRRPFWKRRRSSGPTTRPRRASSSACARGASRGGCSRRGRDDIEAKPTLDRVLVGLLPETAWEVLAVIASTALALGLYLRSRKGGAHVAGSIVTPVALGALALLLPAAIEARWLAANTRAGVVVASDANLVDVTGKALAGPPLPEGASVETGARDGALVHLRWGAAEGWAPLSSVRVMPR